MESFIRLTSLILVLLTLQGCVGLAVSYPYGWNKGGYKYAVVDEKPTTCTGIENFSGKPSSKTVEDNQTTLVYKKGYVWAGVTPMLIIPIPLVLPVWSKTSTYICQDDFLIKASGNGTNIVAAYCGVLSERGSFPEDLGCRVENVK